MVGADWYSDSSSSEREMAQMGDVGNPNPRSTRRVVETRCNTEEVEPGRFVRKCDRTEKLLRDFVGRPTEVVESKTEHTEDVLDGVTSGSVPWGSSGVETFTLPAIRGGFEALERGIQDDFAAMQKGISSLLDAADRMTDGIFRSFSLPMEDRGKEPSPFGQARPAPAERQVERGPSEQMNESAYSEFGEPTEV